MLRFRIFFLGLVATALLSTEAPQVAEGQIIFGGGATNPPGVVYPSPEYYLALDAYRSGALVDATKGFQAAYRAARVDVNGKGIDAIPALVMLGECHYQAGDLLAAQEQFDQALQTSLRHEGWLNALQWPLQVTPVASEWRPPWNPRAQRMGVAQIPTKVILATGVLDQTQTVQQGGVVNAPALTPLNAAEILRTLAVALYRRAEILGPLGTDEALVERLIVSFEKGRAGSIGWTQPMLSVLLGLCYLHDGRTDQAMTLLREGTTTTGNLEHPLSPIARTTLGTLQQRLDTSPLGTQLALDAAASAALQQQPEWVAEALQRVVGPAIARQQAGDVYTASAGAALSMARDFRGFAAQCQSVAAEIAIYNGRLDESNRRMTEVFPLFAGKRGVGSPRIIAYANYVKALLLAAQGQADESLKALALTTQFQQGTGASPGSPRLYQLARLTVAARNAGIGDLTTEKNYLELLKTTDPWFWTTMPMDALALQVSDLLPVRLTLLDIARRRNQDDLTLLRLDALQRQAYRQSTQLGGRLNDFRWLISAPEIWLDPLARNQLQQAIPALMTLQNDTKDINQLVTKLAAVPLDDAKLTAPRKEMLHLLESAATKLEHRLLFIALSRQSVPEVFPPPLAEAPLQQMIPKYGAVLGFFQVGDKPLGYWITKEETKIWSLQNRGIATALAKLQTMLRTTTDPANPMAWNLATGELAKALFPTAWKIPREIQRVVIVPADATWQIPFEMLPRDVEQTDGMIGEACLCTYAPTLGLAFKPLPKSSLGKTCAGITNRFLHKDANIDTELTKSIVNAYTPSTIVSADQYGSGRTASALVKHAWVLSRDRFDSSNAKIWGPLVFDRTLPGGSMQDWINFPWGAPDSLMLPGLDQWSDRNEVATFFPLACGLHAAGIPHFLLSRWPTGGASTAMLMEETLREVDGLGLPIAWSRARAILWQTPLHAPNEPLLEANTKEENVLGNDPRFWAGYLIFAGFE